MPLTSSKAMPKRTAAGTPVPVIEPSPSSWTMHTSSKSAGILRLRLTNLPGWKAEVDGKPLALHRFAGVMLQAQIPAGDHTVELHYWPTTFTAGLALAAGSVVGLVILLYFGRRNRRRTTEG